MLLGPRSLGRPYIERKRLEEVVRGHLKGNRNYTTEIHKLLTLELVHRLFLDNTETFIPNGIPHILKSMVGSNRLSSGSRRDNRDEQQGAAFSERD